jgi:hypothetical protein
LSNPKILNLDTPMPASFTIEYGQLKICPKIFWLSAGFLFKYGNVELKAIDVIAL